MRIKARPWMFVVALALLLAPLFVTGSWILTERLIGATSERDFCASCHSMEPFARSHARDVHGGANPRGLIAHCADCHLPHHSPGGYLWAKITTGTHDAWAELLTLVREPDWIAGLEQRADYVHDSGCLRCHANLQDAEQPMVADLAHQAYFKDARTMRCVDCHPHVGHRDLLALLGGQSGAEPSTDTNGESP